MSEEFKCWYCGSTETPTAQQSNPNNRWLACKDCGATTQNITLVKKGRRRKSGRK